MQLSSARNRSGDPQALARLHANYVWHGMARDCSAYVRGCKTCKRAKIDRLQPAGLTRPLELPAGRWTDVSMDFITHIFIYNSVPDPNK